LQTVLTEKMLTCAAYTYYYHPPPTSLVVSFPVLSSHIVKMVKRLRHIELWYYVFESSDCCVTKWWQKDHEQKENMPCQNDFTWKSIYIYTWKPFSSTTSIIWHVFRVPCLKFNLILLTYTYIKAHGVQ